MLKKSLSILLSISVLLIFSISGCDGKLCQLFPTVTSSSIYTETIPTSPIEPHQSTSTPIPAFTLTPSPENTLAPYPFPAITSDTPIYGNILAPYPMNLEETQILEGPYPGPDFQSQYLTEQAGMNNAYPPPGEDMTIYPTQPMALNPIQTPLPTLGVTETNIRKTTSTMIVRTGLKASDPSKVKLASGRHEFIEFFAFWCPTCKSMAPVINGLEGKYQGRISFVYLDIDDPANKPFMTTLGYRYQPHFFLLDGDGKILKQWAGYVTVDDFEAVLKPRFP